MVRHGESVAKHIKPWMVSVGIVGIGSVFGFSAFYFNIVPVGMYHTRNQLSKPHTVYNANQQELIKFVNVAPYGVLGTQMTKDGKFIQKGTEPEGIHLVIVDPAGLHHIQGLPAGAGGAAGAIYKWLGIDLNQPFDDIIRKKITRPTHAARFVYADGLKPVIHAVGPDLRTHTDVWEVKRELTATYVNIFKEFAEHVRPELDIFRPDDLNQNGITPWGTLRILPVSGGIFSGNFKDDMPNLTVDCITAAFTQLPKSHRRSLAMRTKSIELCIFDEKEIDSFTNVLQKKQYALSAAACDNTIDYASRGGTSEVPVQVLQVLDQDETKIPGYIPPKSGSA